MPGSLVHDAESPNLLGGATLDAAATVTGTVRQVAKPGKVRAVLSTGTVTSTGDSGTLSVELKSADNAAFNSGVVSHGRFAALSGTDASQSSLKRYLEARIDKEYVRATAVIGGTDPDYSEATVYLEQPNFKRVAATDTA